jgi:hypothetical protein
MIFILLSFLGLLGIIGIVYSLAKKRLLLGIVSFLSFAVSTAIILPSFIPVSEKANEAVVKGDMKLVSLIIEDYRSTHNNQSPDDTTLIKLIPSQPKPRSLRRENRFLKTQYAKAQILEGPTRDIAYMIGYAISDDKKKYIILGTDKYGNVLRKKDGSVFYIAND